MTVKRLSLPWSAVLVICIAQPASAQATTTDLTRLLTDGVKIRVVDDRGELTKGRVETISSTAVSLRTRGGTSQLLLQDVAKIQEQDGLMNGALIGLVFGAGLG